MTKLFFTFKVGVTSLNKLFILYIKKIAKISLENTIFATFH
jgi:hypothetical protein